MGGKEEVSRSGDSRRWGGTEEQTNWARQDVGTDLVGDEVVVVVGGGKQSFGQQWPGEGCLRRRLGGI